MMASGGWNVYLKSFANKTSCRIKPYNGALMTVEMNRSDNWGIFMVVGDAGTDCRYVIPVCYKLQIIGYQMLSSTLLHFSVLFSCLELIPKLIWLGWKFHLFPFSW